MRVPLNDYGCAATRKRDNENEKGKKKWETLSTLRSTYGVTREFKGKREIEIVRFYLEEEFSEILQLSKE